MKLEQQFRALRSVMVWAYLPTLAILGAVAGYALATDRRVWYFTNDPFTLGHLPFYAGVLSSLANVLWGAGAAVCFFSVLVLGGSRRDGRGKRLVIAGPDGSGKMEDGSNFEGKMQNAKYKMQNERPGPANGFDQASGSDTMPDPTNPKAYSLPNFGRWRLFLLASGLLTTLLLFDDLFQFHRILYIKYLAISAEVVFAGYGLLALGYLIGFRREIAETEWLLLGVALALFGAAVVFDTAPLLPRGRTAISDGLKFLGIVSWVGYFGRTCRGVLKKLLPTGVISGRQ